MAVAILLGGLVAGGWYLLLPKSQTASAATLFPSVLCAPNVCDAMNGANNSVQDVILRNELASPLSGERWRIFNNLNTAGAGDSFRQVLEIAQQNNHMMKQVVVGVYVTDDVYNNMPTTPLTLDFVRRSCNVSDRPAWNISIRTPGTENGSVLATYDYRTSASAAIRAAATSFCGNVDPVQFDLANYKSLFTQYSGRSLWYAEVVVEMNDAQYTDGYNNTSGNDGRNARFQLRLGNACGAAPTCREYLAMVAAGAYADETRNIALSGRLPQQKKVTTNSSELSDPDEDYVIFNRNTTQNLLRNYMEFGLPCDQGVASSKTIYVYDVNDGDMTPPEEHGWIGGKDISGIVVQYYDETSNVWRSVPASAFAPAQGGSIAGGSLALSHNSDNITSRNHFLYSVEGDNQPSAVIIPSESNGVITRITFTMQPLTKYRFAITPLSARNFIAVGLPGDQIYGLAGCDSYGLQPSVNGSGVIFPGSVAEFGNTIQSDADSASPASNITWQSYGFVLREGEPVPAITGDTTTNYGNGAGCAGLLMCQVLGGNMTPGETILPGGAFTRQTSFTNTSSLGAGDRVCSFLAISPFEIPSGTNTWRVSNVACRPVANKPRVQVLGNDLRVGSSISGGTNLNARAEAFLATSAGSWVEYAITAPGQVRQLASQSGAVNGSSDPQANWSRLTFANTGVSAASCSTGFGCFTSDPETLGKIPSVRAGVLAAGGTVIDRGALPASTSAYVPTTVTGTIVLVTTGTITIDQDIRYASGPLNSANDVPQVILVARDINIRDNVGRVDAWLVASGKVDTCSNIALQTDLRSTDCTNRLEINGPVMATQLSLKRTYSNTAAPTEAAEAINLRGDAYIWANRVTKQNGSWQTVYTTELPPRY